MCPGLMIALMSLRSPRLVNERPVVSNTTPLIALVEVELLEILPILYGTLFIPDAVYQEYQVRVVDGRPSLDTFNWVYPVKTVAEKDLSTALDVMISQGRYISPALRVQVLQAAQETEPDI